MAEPHNDRNDFEAAGDEKEASLFQEIIEFIIEYKKWWLIPIVISFGLIGLLALFSASGAAPFIYTLF
jgi:hypothetical protein